MRFDALEQAVLIPTTAFKKSEVVVGSRTIKGARCSFVQPQDDD
jgi:hypothetical protein